MNIRHDPTESADPDDLVWEPPKTSGFKPGGPVDADYHNWKCADCPGPHKEDHSIRCQKCGDPANALYCERCNIPGKVDAMVVKEVDEIIDPYEDRSIFALWELDDAKDLVEQEKMPDGHRLTSAWWAPNNDADSAVDRSIRKPRRTTRLTTHR